MADSGRVDEATDIDVSNWTDWGWTVVRTTPGEVFLERRRGLPFCVNALLCLVTGFVWLIYWIPRARRPRVDTMSVSVSADGTVSASPPETRR